MSVRILECEEWGQSEKFNRILNGTYVPESCSKPTEKTEDVLENNDKELPSEEMPFPKEEKGRFDFLKLGKRRKEDGAIAKEKIDIPISVPDEIRKYKELLDEGIITQEEFDAKKSQLLNL